MKKFYALFVCTAILFASCQEEPFSPYSTSFEYQFHNGQAIADSPYSGKHPNDFSASMKLKENNDGTTLITITLHNTICDVKYNVQAYDAADPANTSNDKFYEEISNSNVLDLEVFGDGNSVTASHTTNLSLEELINDYQGYFVVHDPLQKVSTSDVSTQVIVGSFAREQRPAAFEESTYIYYFNTGQVHEQFAYNGSHSESLSAIIQVDELADNQSRITIQLINTIAGETYPTYVYDMAGSNGTSTESPYDKTPNEKVFAMSINGNGGLATGTNISKLSYDMITKDYEAFFVIHDPLQEIVVDPTTNVVLGVFAR